VRPSTVPARAQAGDRGTRRRPGALDSARNKPALAGGVAAADRRRRGPARKDDAQAPLSGLDREPLSGVDIKKARKQLEGLDITNARKQVGGASKQFGELTREIRNAGEQAERIGDALS
jgi:hypothetical protein